MKYYSTVTIGSLLFLFITGVVYYLFAPNNWQAAEIILHIHIWAGVIVSIYFLIYLPQHIKIKEATTLDSTSKTISYTLFFALAIVLISGLLHFAPYISYFSAKPFYYRFETYSLISLIHLIGVAALLLMLAIHLNIKKGKK